MSAAAQVIDIRRKAAALVEQDYQHTRSWMASYVNIAAAVGVSDSWLRKFVKGYDEVKEPGFTAGFNIAAYYQQICARIEAKNEARRELIARLEGMRNAATASPDRPMAALAPATPGATRAAPAIPQPSIITDDNLEIPEFLRRT